MMLSISFLVFVCFFLLITKKLIIFNIATFSSGSIGFIVLNNSEYWKKPPLYKKYDFVAKAIVESG